MRLNIVIFKFSYFQKARLSGLFEWWSIGDSGQALFRFAVLEASFCARLDSTEPRPLGTGLSKT
jgi:hypothetical protein